MRRPNYGLDAPIVLRRLVIFGVSAVVLGLMMPPVLERLIWAAGVWSLVCAGVMLWGSKVGKFRLRDRLVTAIPWRGDEKVLDVGCGRGLLLIAAAKRLSTGKAIGVDIWSESDQARNSPQATLDNATIEGVEDRVKLQTGDARTLPFGDETFDVIVSSFAFHNISDKSERGKAIREVVRVLKP